MGEACGRLTDNPSGRLLEPICPLDGADQLYFNVTTATCRNLTELPGGAAGWNNATEENKLEREGLKRADGTQVPGSTADPHGDPGGTQQPTEVVTVVDFGIGR